MTIETSTSIEPKDIQAIEFECKECGTKSVRKIDQKFRTPMACGNCNAPWFISHGTEAMELEGFLRLLERYSKSESPYKMRFQIPEQGENT